MTKRQECSSGTGASRVRFIATATTPPTPLTHNWGVGRAHASCGGMRSSPDREAPQIMRSEGPESPSEWTAIHQSTCLEGHGQRFCELTDKRWTYKSSISFFHFFLYQTTRKLSPSFRVIPIIILTRIFHISEPLCQ